MKNNDFTLHRRLQMAIRVICGLLFCGSISAAPQPKNTLRTAHKVVPLKL
jgi:hypothetical protein